MGLNGSLNTLPNSCSSIWSTRDEQSHEIMEIQFHGDLEIDPTRDMHFLPMALKDSHFENFSDLSPRLDGGRKEAGHKDL